MAGKLKMFFYNEIIYVKISLVGIRYVIDDKMEWF